MPLNEEDLTFNKTPFDKLRDDIVEAVEFWNTQSIHNSRYLRDELSAADVVALIDIIDLYKTHEILIKEENVPPVPYVLPINISTESLVYKKPIPTTMQIAAAETPIKKPKGKKK